ncbi:MAG TPA: APC family permease [Pyrinomonadaceae bacterium]|nr:APC family permease [Pyrinomonadaceae bacterium]
MGRWDLVAATINTVIGAGIFGLPAKAAALLGTYSIYAFIGCAAIVALVVLCFAEVGSRFRSTGGPYLYSREAFGPFTGFEVGWLVLLARIASFAANCNLLVVYLGFFFPAATGSVVRGILIATIVAGLALVNILGIRESKRVTNFLTIAKLLPLAGFIVVGLFFIDPGNLVADRVPSYAEFGGAFVLVIYAFAGFEIATVPAGELRDPQKSLPFGLLVGLAIITLVYLTVQLVCMGTLPGLGGSERPLADAASRFMGPIGASVIAAGAILSILGNSNIGLLGASRLAFAMGEDRSLPAALGQVSPRFRTPIVSTIAVSAVMLLLTVQSTFLSALTLASIARLLAYTTTCIALPVFRRKAGKAPFSLPLGPMVAALSVVLLVILLTNVDFGKEGLPVLVAIGVGAVIFFLTRWWNARVRPAA